MSHISILAMGSRGDIQPYATLGQGLLRAGHQVCFITTENFRELITSNHLDFWPIPGDAEALVAEAGADTLALFRAFGTLTEGTGKEIPEPLKNTDLLINQLPLALIGVDLAEKFSIPMMQASVIPLHETRDFPVVGMPHLRLPGYNQFTYRFAQRAGWLAFRSTINRWRKEVLGLRPQPLRGYFDKLGTAEYPVLNGFSEQIVPRPTDWNEHIHITGYWFNDDLNWQPPEDLIDFLKAGPPPVFIGFGSMPVDAPVAITQKILDALALCGQRAILHTGWGGLGIHDLPETVFQVEYAPYRWLFPQMALVIHHGGSGTTAHALRAGVPSLVIPFIFDQFYWGRRVTEIGVGLAPIPYKRLTAAKLAASIQVGVQDAAMRERAAEVGEKIKIERGIERAVEIIEEFLMQKK
jgi:UDP:flavonoid glycosyltransferase YjiC (YdhE family)